MAPNVTVKAPAGTPQGAVFSTRDGTTYQIGAGGIVSINPIYLNDALAAGFSVPSTFTGAVTANVTANTTGTQAGATALGYGVSQVATAGAAASAVILPAAVPGEYCTVINDGANTIQVFGTSSDTINGIAAATGCVQMASSEITYWCAVAGQWRATPAVGFSGPLNTSLTTANLAANASATQVGATPLPSLINSVNVAAAVNAAVLLPVSAAGMQIYVGNIAANNVNVFPQANEKINGLAANLGLVVPSNKSGSFVCSSPGQWHGLISA